MTLAGGARLGAYDVLALIGAGAWAKSTAPTTPSSVGTSP
jgi:hypothetical protein